MTLTRTFYWSSNQKAYVDAEDPVQWVGVDVCKWGKKTGTASGTVRRTNWSTGESDNLFVTDQPAGTECDHGDSGNPSTGFTAYGIAAGEGAFEGRAGMYCAYSHVTVYRDAFGIGFGTENREARSSVEGWTAASWAAAQPSLARRGCLRETTI
ncbi:hypothetical protein [Thermoactinospora rubra]|uniref:hypothetical protein n=1 Tax=Thermoactinospora rubra TaxID=1088767 RepID=UPI00117E94C5|nr:hypothetical protein [Thermoactinospora rubra]